MVYCRCWYDATADTGDAATLLIAIAATVEAFLKHISTAAATGILKHIVATIF